MQGAELLLGLLLPLVAAGSAGAMEAGAASLPDLVCTPEQTGGFHDYPEGEEDYEPALFHPRVFELSENIVLMMNLSEPGGPDLYLTMTVATGETVATEEEPELTELECRQVRGALGALGYSCVNLPPSEMLLINAESLRFTRTSVGGWTFQGAAMGLNGDSIFVEYGTCEAAGTPAGPPAGRPADGP